MLKEELNKLNTDDIYSLVLFIILQLKQLPEYAVLSELIYSVDKDSLLNLCKQFGGMTITIPTLEELNAIVDTLLLYCYVNIEHQDFDTAIALLGKDEKEVSLIKETYQDISKLISDYDFRRW